MRRYYRVGVQAYMLILNDCRNVLLQDISIVHSPLWNVRLNDCDRVHVRGVYIYSDLEKGVNADGIDIVSSRNVTISDSIIETADDAIVLKTIARDGQPARPTENVTVTNCVLTSSSTALMIGTETEADIRHVLFNNCVIRNSNKGFGINVQDGATVSDVIVSNLTIETSRRHWNWWGSAEMCKFVLNKRTPESRLGVIRDVVVDNVIAHPRGTSTITGHAERPLENIRLSNIDLTMLPENAVDKRATDALRLEHVRGAPIRDLSVRWSGDAAEPKWQSALVLRRVSDFEIDGFTGRQGIRDGPPGAAARRVRPRHRPERPRHGRLPPPGPRPGTGDTGHRGQRLSGRRRHITGELRPPAVERAVRVSSWPLGYPAVPSTGTHMTRGVWPASSGSSSTTRFCSSPERWWP